MKKLMLLVLTLALCISCTALAKPALEKPVQPFDNPSRAAEAEDNGTIASANPFTVGDPMSAAIDPAGDIDFFAITGTSGDCVILETHAGDGTDVEDTKLYVYDAAENELADDDDGGEGYYSMLEFEFPADGTYYIKVIGYNATSYQGTYVLTGTACPEPPEVYPGGETCAEAANLNDKTVFSLNLCDYTNDYDPTGDGCTGWGAMGPDAVYYVILPAGGTVDVCVTQIAGYTDLSLYLLSDCGDPLNACVAGDDSGNPECITYESVEGGTYYLIVDTYSSCGGGEVLVTINSMVAAEESSFSTLKSLY
ncbi:MAG: hypothetical protein GY835_26045 [bacterium]|nr:hypothetical protein [bacterium]